MILDDVAHLLPGLMPGAYRGIGFDVPDTRTEMGRRIAEHLFPGMDRAAYDDMGLLPEVVSVDGVIVGDDYVARAKRLSAAFQSPGPGTLLHPWLGPMTVIVDRPPEISFSSRELRVARFFAYFKRVSPQTSRGGLSTAVALVSAVSRLALAGTGLIRSVGQLTLSRASIAAATRSGRVLSDAVVNAVAQVPGAQGLVAALPVTLPATPAAFAGSVTGLASAIRTAVPALTAGSPVAPAFEAAAPVEGLTALAGLTLSIDLSGRLSRAAVDAPAPADRAILLGAAGALIAETGTMLGHARLATRQDASAVRAAIASGTDALATTSAALSETSLAGPAAELRRMVTDLRAAAIADINEVIGRLPQVVVVNTDRPADAFQVASHLFGDTPSAIEAGYQDIVARNRSRHPAQLPAGRIEATR